MPYPIFPKIVPLEYSSAFKSYIFKMSDQKSAFETVSPKYQFNNVKQNIPNITFYLYTESDLNECLSVIDSRIFELKLNETDKILVRRLAYSHNQQAPNLYILTLSVEEVIKP
jgi:hypothetical protein